MIWIIIISVIIIGVVLFKVFDRDFILAIPQKKDTYLLKFESGKEPICKFMGKYKYDDYTYYVFVPFESLDAIPSEDIIILKCVKQTAEKLICVFPEPDKDERILKAFYKEYKDRYNFIFD